MEKTSIDQDNSMSLCYRETRVVLVFVCKCVQGRFGGESRKDEETLPPASGTSDEL